MGVILGGQAKMSGALRSIFCLLHRTQGQTANQSLFRRSICLFQQFLNLFWMDFSLGSTEKKSEIVDKSRKLLHLFRIRIVMGPVQERKLLPEEIFRYRFIGCQHKIFNHLCGCIPLIRLDFQWFSPVVQDDFALRKFKVNGASLPSFFP